jgi:hypothetical protein
VQVTNDAVRAGEATTFYERFGCNDEWHADIHRRVCGCLPAPAKLFEQSQILLAGSASQPDNVRRRRDMPRAIRVTLVVDLATSGVVDER